MKFIIYLIGFCFLLAIYGIYNAVTIHYFHSVFTNDFLFYSAKIIELIIALWFMHHFLKETVYQGLGIGEAFLKTLKLPKQYFNKQTKQ